MNYFKYSNKAQTRLMFYSSYLVLILHLACLTFLQGQSSVFVLVDVSASGPNILPPRDEAKNIVKDICIGGFSSSSLGVNWKWSGDVYGPLVKIKEGKGQLLNKTNKNGYMMIMPFGNKDTYKRYQIKESTQLNTEFSSFYHQYYPAVFKDSHTYIRIAEAGAAGIAISKGINSYFLIEITDDLSDTDSGAGYSKEEKELIDQYGTEYIIPTRLGTLRYEAEEKNYQIIFKSVKIKKHSSPKTPEPKSKKKPEEKPKISFVRPAKKSKKMAPFFKKDRLDVVWSCRNCIRGTKVLVHLDCVDCRGKKKSDSKSSTKTKVSFDIKEQGLYKVTLSAKGLASTSTYVTLQPTSSGGSKVFLAILIFLALFLVIVLMAYRHFNSPQAKSNEVTKPARPTPSTPPSSPSSSSKNIEDIFNDF